jgi:hypothetical protein
MKTFKCECENCSSKSEKNIFVMISFMGWKFLNCRLVMIVNEIKCRKIYLIDEKFFLRAIEIEIEMKFWAVPAHTE